MRRMPLMLLLALAACSATPAPQSPPGAQTTARPSPPDGTSRPTAATSSTTPSSARPATWAQPLTRPGLPNLFRVDDHYYRGAQPTAEGMGELQGMGVRTVVNLRSMHDDADKIGGRPLRYEHIPVAAWHAEQEDVVRFLKVVTRPEAQPVFVHCQHGSDRTGMMTAIYRIVVLGWSKDDAIAEMTQGGFGFHPIWQDLVDYVRHVDVDGLRREAGIAPPKVASSPVAGPTPAPTP